VLGKVLVIFENDDKADGQSLSLITCKLIGDKIDSLVFDPLKGFPADFPNSTAGVIVGGGLPSVNDPKDWIAKEINLIMRAASLRLPILGICFGHQLIAKAFGSEVIRGQRMVGFANIVKIKDSPIFNNLPQSWRSPIYHQDRVSFVPEDFELIATSDYCEIQAMQHSKLPIWTVQFHPEIDFGANQFFADPVEEWNDEAAFESGPNKQLIDNFIDVCLSGY